jgi:hypothetical protein
MARGANFRMRRPVRGVVLKLSEMEVRRVRNSLPPCPNGLGRIPVVDASATSTPTAGLETGFVPSVYACSLIQVVAKSVTTDETIKATVAGRAIHFRPTFRFISSPPSAVLHNVAEREGTLLTRFWLSKWCVKIESPTGILGSRG